MRLPPLDANGEAYRGPSRMAVLAGARLVLEDPVSPVCSVCASVLRDDAGVWVCAEGHTFTAMALALATNTRALRALWVAVRALEDDAAALLHLAAGDDMTALASAARRREAASALDAAATLREHALAAQQRAAWLCEDDGTAMPPGWLATP